MIMASFSVCFHFSLLKKNLPSWTAYNITAVFIIYFSCVMTVINGQTMNKLTFSTKTMYANSFSKHHYKIVHDTAPRFVPGHCKPIQVNALVRHGARFPSAEDLFRAINISERIRNNGFKGRLKGFDNYQIQFKTKFEKELANVGQVEIDDLAHRFVQKYPEVFKDVEAEELMFYSSNKSRTVKSAETFQESLYKSLKRNPDENKSLFLLRDDILRFFDNCTSYVKTVVNNSDAMKHYKDFQQSKRMVQLAKKLTKHLGLPAEVAFTSADLKVVHTLAALETGILGDSIWTKVLDAEDIETLEYNADLKHYWRKSYGYKVNYEQSCPLLQDMVGFLQHGAENHKHGSSFIRGTFRFAHAETHLPLISLLGLYHDQEPLQSDNFEHHRQRLFRTSQISPFAANVALILYHCDESSHDKDIKSKLKLDFPQTFQPYMVQLLVNELPVKFPFCKYHICSLQQVLEEYDNYLTQCNFDDACKLNLTEHDEL